MNKIYAKLLIGVLFLLGSVNIFAQPSNYVFAGSTGAYSAIVGTTVTFSLPDDASTGNLPIGFTFSYNSINQTVFAASTNGLLIMGQTTNGTGLSGNALASTANTIAGLWDDNNMTGGTVQYLTTGIAPNRILTVQYTGMHVGGTGSTTNPTINLQILLYETSNNIQIVYGATSAALATTTASIGLSGNSGNFLSVTPTSASAPFGTTSNVTENTGISAATFFPTGTIYTFSPPPPCVAPTSLAASVTATPGVTTVAGSFTAAPPTAPTGYLVVRTATNVQPVPVTGTTYTVGSNAIGYIEYVNTAAGSWTSTGLTPSTTYYYWVFSYNSAACSGGPVYSATASTATATTTACSIAGGTYSVGPAGTHATLKAAVDAAVLNGVTGPVIFELNAAYLSTTDATFPIVLGPVPCASAVNTITIRPAAGAGAKTITSANTTATLDINGGNYWIIDGRQGGIGVSKDLTIANTSTATGGTAIRFINEGSNNIVRYSVLKALFPSATSGVVVFSNTTGANGNDNNTINTCDIDGGAAATASPTLVAQNGVYSSGTTTTTAQNNSGNTISNCNIFNNFVTGVAATSAGILVLTGNTDWTINANSIYQTNSRTATTGAATVYGISIANSASGNNFIVTNNFVGGSAASNGGTAWTIAGAVANRFNGIGLSVGTTTASSVQGNTISNFSFTSTSGATANSTSSPLGTGVWGGIYVGAGSVNIGTTTSNTVGATTGVGSITVTGQTAAATANGIGCSGSGIVNISNNFVGSITATGAGAISTGIIGILSSATGTVTINNNVIGSKTTPLSLNASLASTSAATAQQVVGISNTGAATAIAITNNTVANINNAYNTAPTTAITTLRGIASSSGVGTVTGNTIRNLTGANPGVGTGSTASVMAIAYTSATAGNHTVSQDTIYAISNSTAAAATHLYGIYYSGPSAGTNLVARNFVHSLSLSSSSATADLTGIYIGGGIATYQNNMIRLGIDAAGASLTNGIIIAGIDKQTATNNNIYFNSVYIGGTGVATNAANTFAFRRNLAATDILQNNIFFNARSNGASTGKHYAAGLVSTATLTIDYNDYFANGTGGLVGYIGAPGAIDYATFAAFKVATAQDVKSLNVDPPFNSPTTATPNLHITTGAAPNTLESAGLDIGGIINDFDNDTRPGPTGSVNGGGFNSDIGADEFDGFNAAACSGTPAAGGTVSASVATICSLSNVTFTLTGATTGVGIQYQWQSSPAGLNTWSDVVGATNVVSVIPAIAGNTDYRCRVKCAASGLFIFSTNTVTVNGINCQYNVTRTTGNTYTSIITTGSTYTAPLAGGNGDDAATNNVPLTGTTFKYKGAPVTAFYATTNGWLSFNTALITSSFTNDLTSTGQNTVLAPFWDDLVIKGGTSTSAANLNTCMRYQVNGVLGSGTADIIIEWADMERFSFGPPNINFQVVLHESDNSIDYNYGNIQLYDGSLNNATLFTYSVGLNQANPAGTALTDRMILLRENTSYFTTANQTALSLSPECNSRLRFVPGTYIGTDPGAPGVPVNNETAGAITVSVNAAPCTSLCGNIYTSANATATSGITACSAGAPGTPDDDVWFKFTTSTAPQFKIDVTPSLNYDAVVQLLDAAFIPVACVNAAGIGLSETMTNALSPSTLYYVRIYHAGATIGSSNGEFALCVSEVIPPPTNDECVAATTLALNATCVPTNSELPATLAATASAGIPLCSAATPGTPDDDVWYKFTTNATVGANYVITVQGVSTYNPVLQLLSGACGANTAVACVNATGNGGVETYSTAALAVSTTYFVRVYHSGVGAANGNFNICVSVPLPSCPTTFTPANASSTCASVTATTLSWTAATNATGYDVYFNAGAGPAVTLVSTNQAGLTYSAGILAAGVYSWRIEPKNVNGTTVCSNLTFTVNAAPTINITPAGPINICAPATQTLTLGSTSAASPTYQWKNGGVNIAGQTGTTYIASASGSYTLQVTDGVTGCVGISNAVLLTVNPSPTGVTAIPSITTICQGSTINLSSTPSPIVGTNFSETFDAVTAPALPNGWTATNASGSAPLWVTTISTPNSAPNAVFIDDPSTVSDKLLETPSISIATGSSPATVTFMHKYTFESGFDGGVLEISIDGGAYADIITAGGTFTAGGYTGTISSSFSNPLAGRSAWTGAQATYTTVTITLPSGVVGHSFKLRWRMGSDTSTGSTGWFVDDVQVTSPSFSYTYNWTSTPGGFTSSLQNPTTVTPASSGITYTVAVTLNGCPTSATTAAITVNQPTVAPTGFSSPTTICNTGSTTITQTGGSLGTGAHWQWYTNAGYTTTIGGNLFSADAALVVSPTVTTTYYVRAEGATAPCTATVAGPAGGVKITVGNTWTGTTSADWSVTTNWGCGAVPSVTDEVVIPTGVTNMPQLTSNITVANINLQSATTLDINGFTFTINGVVTGTGTLSGSSTSNLTLAGAATTVNFTGGSRSLNNLSVGAAGSATLGTALDIYGTVGFTAGGSLNMNGQAVTLKSNATNTARIADLTGSTLSGATNVTMERWIPQRGASATGGRAYRLMASTVNTTGTVKANWMEGVNNTAVGTNINPNAGYGTQISGSGGASSNFDVTASNAPSLYLASNGTIGSLTYTPVGSTTTGVGASLNALTGYFLYIRGDRSVSLQVPLASNMPTTSTTLRTTGTLVTGPVSLFTNAYTGGGAHNLVTNPYPSPIDWSLVQPASTGITAFYTFWDPNVGIRGGFVTVNKTELGPTRYIQSGQAFFVESDNIAPTPAVNILESHKSAGNNNGVFLVEPPPVESFKTELYFTEVNGFRRIADRVTAVYDNKYSAAVDSKDAKEIGNWDENIAIARDGKRLAIESRPVIGKSDDLPIFMNNMKKQAYEFEFTPLVFTNTNLKAELIDNYLGTRTLLSVVNPTVVSFTITADAASKATDRFKVVFGAFGSPQGVDAITIKASQQNGGVQVNWTSKTETDMVRYEVEKSTYGTTFAKANSTTARGNSTTPVDYNWFDAKPNMGTNFYRIKGIDKAGNVRYSDIVRVLFGKGEPAIVVYPNPVQGNTFKIDMYNLVKGTYLLNVYNNMGQKVYTEQLQHDGSQATKTINLKGEIGKGTYQLQLSSDNGFKTTKILIKN